MRNLVKLLFFGVFGIVFTLEAPAQVNTQTTSRSTGSLTSGTIDSQFIYLSRISKNQEDFKLVRRRNLDLIRQNVADSLQSYRNELANAEDRMHSLTQEVGELRDSLTHTHDQLDRTLALEKTTSIFGARVSTMTYHLIVWGIILLLIIVLAYSLIRMGQNNMTTREARSTLEGLQEEYDQHRKKSLEKEQKLMRQLQDEINKGNT